LVFPKLENAYSTEVFRVIQSSSGYLAKLKAINSENDIDFSYNYTYNRGIPNPKIDSLFLYTLPFKKGKKLMITEAYNVGERHFGSERPSKWKYYIIYTNSADSIYCMRKGLVVEIKDIYESDTLLQKNYTSYRNSILIEHADGSYAEYRGFKKNSILVELGQTVYPQTQLGIVDKFNKEDYRLDFSVYYLIDDKLERKENQTLKDIKCRYEYLSPYFITKNGVCKIEHRKEYTVEFNETILLEELTKKEKKKYKNNPELFN